ncbi:MAG TPA: TonB-dependent receptor [Candidatus Acidoferrales bacterium]|nr:TonB-dependent receptor [Candidatus Acidoferrales bacterium]
MNRVVGRAVLLSVAIFGLAGIATRLDAQTAASARIVGTVTDPSGAVIAGAQVELKNTATGQARSVAANASGDYVFPDVAPGAYSITVTRTGFRGTTISNLNAEVSRSYTVNVTLQVGAVTQTVTVEAAGGTELQTTDAQIGNVLGANQLLRLPTLQHDAGELLSLQPGVSPSGGSGNTIPVVRVAGALEDQNTYTLNGIDVTDYVVAGTAGGGVLPTVVPIPVDSVEEFRVGVANPNATFGRSSGGQVALVTRSGTNDFHGAVYWYTQNDELNANEWENNRAGIKRAELKDNRGGFRFGGPFWKNKTWFFGNYDFRRFPQSSNISRLVPADTLKQGVLRFQDASGNIVSYNLASSTLCGSSGTTACDPRGIGLDPSIQKLWALMPPGNDPTQGDGLNTIGFRSTAGTPLKEDYVVFRLDQSITEKWKFAGVYNYSRHLTNTSTQTDIRGGNAQALTGHPVRGDLATASLTGQLTPNLLNTFRFGWVRQRWATSPLLPNVVAGLENLPGTSSADGPIALGVGQATTGTFLDVPIDVAVGRARFQAVTARQFQYVDDLDWVKGNHTFEFGGDIRPMHTILPRTDKVVGSITALVALVDADVSPFLTISSADRPRTCGAAVSTNCLPSTQVQQWDRLYASALGLVDNTSILTVRDGNLNPLPFGTFLNNDSTNRAYYFYGQDSWRLKPSLTLTYGLNYGWQTPPVEALGRQTLLVSTSSGQILNAPDYINAKASAASQGQTFNPQLGFVPVKSAHHPIFNTDYGNFGPRVALAWNPLFDNGLLHRVFGDRKAVVRTGYSMIYDRTNTVQSEVIPTLGVGFAQTINVAKPNCGASGAPGPGCNTSPGTPNPGLSSFRVGIDGSLPLPTVPSSISIPIVPSTPFGETLSFQVDPNNKIARVQSFDFDIQRDLPGSMMIDVAWVGRWSTRLAEAMNFNNSPYFFKDPQSGQTFAQAFDAVATSLRQGQPVSAQPWFENQLPGLATLGAPFGCKGTVASSTACIAANNTSAFVSGLVSSLFTTMNLTRTLAMGLPSYNNLESLVEFMRTYAGVANYQGLLVTLHKRASRGLSFDLNYTFSKSLDDGVSNQNSAGFFANAYSPKVEYGRSSFDRRNIFSATYYYQLPAGKGHVFHFNNFADKFIGGWYTTGIFTAYTGTPLIVGEGSQVWGGGDILSTTSGAVPLAASGSFGVGVHSGVPGSGGVGVTGNPAKHGSGLNIFGDPQQAFNLFRPVLIGTDGRDGNANPLTGLGLWNLDMSLGKSTALTERVNMEFSFEFFNIFNHVNFLTPTLNLQTPTNFGVITQQFVPADRADGARWIEFGMRFEF